MEQEKKKLNLKIIIPVVIVILVIAVVGIAIIKNNTLTKEEQYAVDYLLSNRAIQPNTVEISRVWVYQEGNKWYFAYDITFKNTIAGDIEIIYGNEERYCYRRIRKLIYRLSRLYRL